MKMLSFCIKLYHSHLWNCILKMSQFKGTSLTLHLVLIIKYELHYLSVLCADNRYNFSNNLNLSRDQYLWFFTKNSSKIFVRKLKTLTKDFPRVKRITHIVIFISGLPLSLPALLIYIWVCIFNFHVNFLLFSHAVKNQNKCTSTHHFSGRIPRLAKHFRMSFYVEPRSGATSVNWHFSGLRVTFHVLRMCSQFFSISFVIAVEENCGVWWSKKWAESDRIKCLTKSSAIEWYSVMWCWWKRRLKSPARDFLHPQHPFHATQVLFRRDTQCEGCRSFWGTERAPWGKRLPWCHETWISVENSQKNLIEG